MDLLLAGIFFIFFLELRAIRKVHQARWDYERHILLDKERRELNVLTGAATTNGDDLDFRIRVGKLLMSPYPTHCKSEQIFQERLEALKKSPMPSKAPAHGGTQQRNEIMRLTKRTNII